MQSWKDEYVGLVLVNQDTNLLTFFQEIADGNSLDCKLVTAWEMENEIPRHLCPQVIKLKVDNIRFHSSKTQFTISGFLFGEMPLGIKPCKCQLTFNRHCVSAVLPDDIFETSEEVLLSAGEFFNRLFLS